MLLGPKDYIDQIKSTFPSKIDCSSIDTYPNLSLNIEGNFYEITPRNYILRFDGDACSLGLESSPFLKSMFILGDVFLRNYYTHFDYEGSRVGFAVPRDFGVKTAEA